MMESSSDIRNRKSPSFGFVSTRFSRTDGVSSETAKWVEVLRRKGCTCNFMTGELDTDPEWSHEVSNTFFRYPEIEAFRV